MSDSGRALFSLNFEASPITLVGGVAASMPGGQLGINALTMQAALALGILGSPTSLTTVQEAFATFVPFDGGSLIDQDLGDYPLANQTVAANAVIAQPLVISMKMIATAKQPGDLMKKQAFFSSLQATLAQHNNKGGLYHVNTPAFFYQNCVLLKMVDVTPESMKQPQSIWRLDFKRPLVTLQDAQGAQNSLMQQLTNGAPAVQDVNGAVGWTGFSATVGSPSSNVLGQVAPISQNVSGVNIGASLTPTSGAFGVPGAQAQPTVAAVQTATAALGSLRSSYSTSLVAANVAGQSVAGSAASAAFSAFQAGQAAALYSAMPGRGLTSASASVATASAALTAARRSLQFGYAGNVSDAGLASLQALNAAASAALSKAQIALENALQP